MTDLDLELLRGAWARAVKIHDPERGSNPGMKPCWFRGGDYGPCEGWIEGAHWIKRQTVERWIVTNVLVDFDPDAPMFKAIAAAETPLELSLLAAWDARNGVPACERHHRIFDSQRVPLPSEQIVVPRLLVPDHVEEFAADWGLEHELERKHPA